MTSSFIGKVLDNYRILERLGIGGMGVVFKAIHIKLEKVFAVKIIAPGLAMNESFIKRFEIEARSLAKFEDPNIVRIYDLRHDNDQWFIVMEYVDGITLLDKINNDGAFQWQEALPVLKQMLSAIGHAHEAGIVHRDIKPNNIMINKEGVVKITDFGLAKDQTSMISTLTVTSGGTLYYMSPEHVKGFSFIDKRSDIYSLGMTFYEMLTGSVPFKNLESDFDIRESIIRKDCPKPTSLNPDIPLELEAIVMKSIAKNPDDRYQTTVEMIEAIKKIESDFGIIDTKLDFPAGHAGSRIPANDEEGFGSRTKENRFVRIGIPISALIAIIIVSFLYYNDYFSIPSDKQDLLQQSSLSISSQPGNALVYLNRDSIGHTPLKDFSIPSGTYSINLSKDNYNPVDTTIQIASGETFGFNFTMRPIDKAEQIAKPVDKPETKESIPEPADTPTLATISIRSNPADAEIWINNQLKGKTPFNLKDIEAGNCQLKLRKEGFAEYEKLLNLSNGVNGGINVSLVPFTGEISITKEPASASVLLDGKEISSENTSQLSLRDIPIGKHRIEIKEHGYSLFVKEVEIKRDNVSSINAKLSRVEGSLTIQVRPWGSIYINGELQKTSPDRKYKVSLPVDEYSIKVVHPTLGMWEKKVQVLESSNKDLIVNFTKKIPVKVSAFDENGSPVIAEIFIDDKDTGKSTPEEVQVHIGVHTLLVKKEGYDSESVEKTIFVDEDFSESQMFILKKKNKIRT